VVQAPNEWPATPTRPRSRRPTNGESFASRPPVGRGRSGRRGRGRQRSAFSRAPSRRPADAPLNGVAPRCCKWTETRRGSPTGSPVFVVLAAAAGVVRVTARRGRGRVLCSGDGDPGGPTPFCCSGVAARQSHRRASAGRSGTGDGSGTPRLRGSLDPSVPSSTRGVQRVLGARRARAAPMHVSVNQRWQRDTTA
jgi:hypothetical protein